MADCYSYFVTKSIFACKFNLSYIAMQLTCDPLLWSGAKECDRSKTRYMYTKRHITVHVYMYLESEAAEIRGLNCRRKMSGNRMGDEHGQKWYNSFWNFYPHTYMVNICQFDTSTHWLRDGRKLGLCDFNEFLAVRSLLMSWQLRWERWWCHWNFGRPTYNRGKVSYMYKGRSKGTSWWVSNQL